MAPDDTLNSARKTGYINPHAGQIGIAAISSPVHLERVAYEERVAEVRSSLLGMEEAVLGLCKDPLFEDITELHDRTNTGEAIANAKLAYRHIEDARMRLGKVLQALNDGRSILPR